MSDKSRIKSQDLEKVEKPWGYELIWARTEKYLGKFINIAPEKRMSLQYHKNKEETIYVMSGRLKIWESPDNDDKYILLGAGAVYHVKPGQVHRFGATKIGAMICEVSTGEFDDVVRLHDDYDRK